MKAVTNGVLYVSGVDQPPNYLQPAPASRVDGNTPTITIPIEFATPTTHTNVHGCLHLLGAAPLTLSGSLGNCLHVG